MTKIHLLGISLLALGACGDDSARHTCGAGTTVANGECVAVDGGNDNPGATCGSGTHLEGTSCVPDPAGGGTAPTIAAITPSHSGISGLTADGGGVLFEITGTNFMDPNGGDLTVTFGTVKAVAVVVDDMTIDGVVPSGTALDVTVTVANANGNATTPFEYDALIAGDGHGIGGDAYVLDPDSGLSIDLGPLVEDDGAGGSAATGVSGLAFDSNGTLYATTLGTEGDPGQPNQLVSINLQTAVTTIIGPLQTSDGRAGATDLKFSGATLYAAAFVNDPANEGTSVSLATIDVATGSATAIGALPAGENGDAIAFDGSGTLYYSGNGTAGDGSADGGAGAFYSLDTATGSATQVASLDLTDSFPISAMAVEHGRMYAVINTAEDSSTGSSVIGTIDPATGHITPLAAIPPRIDAIAAPPASVALPRVASVNAPWRATVASTTAAARCVPLAAVPAVRGTVTVSGCGGASRTVTLGTRYALVKNRRGRVKLVDRTTHRTLLRNVTSVR